MKTFILLAALAIVSCSANSLRRTKRASYGQQPIRYNFHQLFNNADVHVTCEHHHCEQDNVHTIKFDKPQDGYDYYDVQDQPYYQPPRYQPQPAYQQPQYEPQQSYQQPEPSYQQPEPSYQQPEPTYQPQPSYQQPQPSYQQPQPSYQQPQPSYQQPQPTYQQPAAQPSYAPQPAPSYPQVSPVPVPSHYQPPQQPSYAPTPSPPVYAAPNNHGTYGYAPRNTGYRQRNSGYPRRNSGYSQNSGHDNSYAPRVVIIKKIISASTTTLPGK